MSSRKRASLSSNSPLDQLFAPAEERREQEKKQEQEQVQVREVEREARAQRPAPAPQERSARSGASLVQEPQPIAEEPERELRQTTIMIYDDQADWLDEACYLARRESGSNISKAAILRALVDMAREDAAVREQLRDRLGIG